MNISIQAMILASALAVLPCTQGCVANQIPGADVGYGGMPYSDDAPYDGVTLIRLANGLSVLVKEDRRFPTVSTRLYVRAGSAVESGSQAGISHLLEHMVFKGTSKYPKGTISRTLEAAGAYLNAATGFDYTVYVNDLPSGQWRTGLDAVAEMAFRPTLDPAELRAEKEVVITELKRGRDNPHTLLFQQLQAEVLRGTPYERPVIGYEESIRAVTPEAMRAYVGRLYQPQNMLLTVVGDVDASEVLKEAGAVFGRERNRSGLATLLPIEASTLHPHGVKVSRGPWRKAYFALGIPVPGGNDLRSVTLDVLARVLGGDGTSVFVRRYRDNLRLVDSISVDNVSFAQLGMLMITAEMDPRNIEPFWSRLVSDLNGLAESGFDGGALSRVKFNIEDGLYRNRETISGMASHLGSSQFLFGGRQGESNAVQALRLVDGEALRAGIAKWVRPDRSAAVWIVPSEAECSQTHMEAVLEESWTCRGDIAGTGGSGVGEPEVIDLGHGRRLVLAEDGTMPHFALSMAYDGGEALTGKDGQGLASLVARALTAGAADLSREDIEERLSDMAADLSASAGRRRFVVTLTGPTVHSLPLLGILEKILTQPRFDGHVVARERALQIADIRAAEERPLGLLFRRLPGFLFPQGVYGYVPNGDEAMVAGYGEGQCRAFWRLQAAHGWVMSVVGSFDRDAVLEFARRLPEPSEAPVQVASPTWNSERRLDLTMHGRNQAHLLLVYPTVPETSAETPALALLSEAVGGMGGPLFTELRDRRGLGYDVAAFSSQNDKLGYFGFYIGTEPGRLGEAERAFTEIIEGLRRRPLPVGEVSRGLHHWQGSEVRSGQSLMGRAVQYAGLVAEGKPLSHRKDLLAAAGRLTPVDLRDAARRHLRPEKMYRIVVLP